MSKIQNYNNFVDKIAPFHCYTLPPALLQPLKTTLEIVFSPRLKFFCHILFYHLRTLKWSVLSIIIFINKKIRRLKYKKQYDKGIKCIPIKRPDLKSKTWTNASIVAKEGLPYYIAVEGMLYRRNRQFIQMSKYPKNLKKDCGLSPRNLPDDCHMAPTTDHSWHNRNDRRPAPCDSTWVRWHGDKGGPQGDHPRRGLVTSVLY